MPLMNLRDCRALERRLLCGWYYIFSSRKWKRSKVSARRSQECAGILNFASGCHNVSDADICSICANSLRNQRIICVVENIRDVIAIENTQQFSGTYHILGGVISPLDGIGPDQLQIESLISRLAKEQTEELVFALSPNIQGDTTIYYIQKKMQNLQCRVTTIARGIAFGGELEYADELTLGRSLQNRMPVDRYISH
jgi:recombination protein RecR